MFVYVMLFYNDRFPSHWNNALKWGTTVFIGEFIISIGLPSYFHEIVDFSVAYF